MEEPNKRDRVPGNATPTRGLPHHESRDPNQPIANFRCNSVASEEARFPGLLPLKSLSVIKQCKKERKGNQLVTDFDESENKEQRETLLLCILIESERCSQLELDHRSDEVSTRMRVSVYNSCSPSVRFKIITTRSALKFVTPVYYSVAIAIMQEKKDSLKLALRCFFLPLLNFEQSCGIHPNSFMMNVK
ncbi:hypothetical protein WN51_09252 [Melipona quadrifasciata]|uniref:Uncharacterized protein n=1 Tax=Melipona quadrifasciata TaxID=166423 RepID=A0A0N0BIF5_9HYME|nr:hypothetical protein WN51_09252 [Melipona quadrifasciata]